ncbi:unnamed protein product, partial [Citrullus colocynthis]
MNDPFACGAEPCISLVVKDIEPIDFVLSSPYEATVKQHRPQEPLTQLACRRLRLLELLPPSNERDNEICRRKTLETVRSDVVVLVCVKQQTIDVLIPVNSRPSTTAAAVQPGSPVAMGCATTVDSSAFVCCGWNRAQYVGVLWVSHL